MEPADNLIEEDEEEKPIMFSSSAGQPKSTVPSIYDRSVIYEEELAEESVEEAATPGFGIFLALDGFLGTAFCLRRNRIKNKLQGKARLFGDGRIRK